MKVEDGRVVEIPRESGKELGGMDIIKIYCIHI